MRIAFFGSSLVSSYWNGAATYYRGLIRALARRGHEVTFFEPDAFERQQQRDIADPPWAEVVVWQPTAARARELVGSAARYDVVVKASGVGVLDTELERLVHGLAGPTTIFWDVDAPATLARLHAMPNDPFRPLVPGFDLVLTYGGGCPVVEQYLALGARACAPVYNALDPEEHHPEPADGRFEADLALLANRLPDREQRIEHFFLRAALAASERTFLLGGSGWEDKPLPPNVRACGHVGTADHNAFNSTPLAVLNVTRESMAANGWSPATRVFEAAGAGACLITDAWAGIEDFLEPGSEVLVAHDGDEVAGHLSGLAPSRAAAIGAAARARVESEHTYAHRAEQVESLLRTGVAA
jgi:spore maturation protein CgeB